ncbi:MAG: SPFH domain-containing protein [Actinomycetia bacterium]|nr:SPFH domain-containing protein [Actinomycetes bacterium]
MSTPSLRDGNAGPVAPSPIQEKPAWHVSGALALLLVLVLLFGGTVSFVWGVVHHVPAGVALWAVGWLVALVVWSGLKIISPGDTRVVQFFGTYIGTVRRPGLIMTAPLTLGTKVSVKVRNFETNELKVNDADGNPVNIAAIVVWQVEDTAKACFAVESYGQFVATQSESALRHIASSHPYDATQPGVESLRGSTEQVAQELAEEVSSRIALAGLRVVETRISSLAYAPEIAQAMLQRQQAAAIIAAREKIVEGAVTMVQSALGRLEEEHIVDLDDERKATMVANLLVVLCGDQRATPVINTGSLYAG